MHHTVQDHISCPFTREEKQNKTELYWRKLERKGCILSIESGMIIKPFCHSQLGSTFLSSVSRRAPHSPGPWQFSPCPHYGSPVLSMPSFHPIALLASALFLWCHSTSVQSRRALATSPSPTLGGFIYRKLALIENINDDTITSKLQFLSLTCKPR